MKKIMDILIRNPFFILEIPVGSTSQEIERQGMKILGMIELDVRAASEFPTPWGTQIRDAADVRQAMAELRDPVQYHFHAFWLPDTGSTVEYRQEKKKTAIDFLAAAGFRSIG